MLRRITYCRSRETIMKSRRVVTRTGRGFRGYFPSKKVNRMVEYESLLERDAIYLFEHSPGIKSFQEQPELVMYEYENKIRKYYPDFAVTLNSEVVIHTEVKPQIKLNCPDLNAKLTAIVNRYQNHSADFMILTELTIRKEPLFSNLKTINSVNKYHLDIEKIFLKCKKLITSSELYTVKEISEVFGKTEVLIMLAHPLIVCDLNQPIWGRTNFVRVFKEADHDTLFF